MKSLAFRSSISSIFYMLGLTNLSLSVLSLFHTSVTFLNKVKAVEIR